MILHFLTSRCKIERLCWNSCLFLSMEGFQVLPHNVFISRLSSYLSSLVTSWHLKGSILFVGHTRMGVGSSPFTFPWGPGNSLAFIYIKSECPGHARGGGFGVFKWQVHNSLCLNLLFNFVYWNYFVSMFWCLFWKEDSPKKWPCFWFVCFC